MNELARISAWLYTTLAAATDLTDLVQDDADDAPRISADVAPRTMGHPLVVYSNLSAIDMSGMAARRVWVDSVWLVRAIDLTDTWTGLSPIADEIDVALHDIAGTQYDLTIDRCWREEAYQFVEADSSAPGTYWRHLGGRYRILAYATP